MPGRLLLAGFLLLVPCLVGCRPPQVSKEEALLALIGRAAEGRAPVDVYREIAPEGEVDGDRLAYLEAWLDVNAEAVQGVVASDIPAEGSFRFTRSPDGRFTYLIALGWPGSEVRSVFLKPAPGARITLLGWEDSLPWVRQGDTLVVATPREMGDEANHPCVQAFVFRVEAPPR